jgi:RimJ/RimL family protein N-acetyltransferase
VNDAAPYGRLLIRTDRLDLRMPQADDLAGLMDVLADEETRRFLGPMQADAKGQFDRLLRNVGSWTLYGYGSFAVRLRGTERIVGTCGVFHTWRSFGQGMDDVPEAGWIFHRDHWGQGLAREAMRAVLAWFDHVHGARRIACMIEQGNAGSEKVALALGFRRYGEQLSDGATLGLYERLPDGALTPAP